MALIQDDIFDSIVESVYDQLANDGLTYNGTAVNAFVNINSENEKRLGADCDIEVEIKIDDLDAITSSVSKSDVIIYGGISYDNIVMTEKTDFCYNLKAFKALS